MSDSKGRDHGALDIERDLPAKAEDVRVLGELREAKLENALVHANRLLAPGWTLARAAARPLFEGCRPFTLEELRADIASFPTSSPAPDAAGASSVRPSRP